MRGPTRRVAACRRRAGRGTGWRSPRARRGAGSSPRARAVPLSPTPWISSPNATLSITRRCASRPKCWKTIDDVWRRNSRKSAWLAAITSLPAISICPAVGSIRRISVRTSVDLPEPERPITTNTSLGHTSNETSRTAATQSCFSRSSARGRSASGVPITLSAWRPKIFQTPSARISGSPLRSISCPGATELSATAVTALRVPRLSLETKARRALRSCRLRRCRR